MALQHIAVREPGRHAEASGSTREGRLEDGALSVDLIDKALFVEFDSHGLKSSCLSQSFVLPLDKEADGSHTVALLCLLQPVVHDCCKIDIIGQLALA